MVTPLLILSSKDNYLSVCLSMFMIRSSTGSCGVGVVIGKRRSLRAPWSTRNPLVVKDSGSALVKLSSIFPIPLPWKTCTKKSCIFIKAAEEAAGASGVSGSLDDAKKSEDESVTESSPTSPTSSETCSETSTYLLWKILKYKKTQLKMIEMSCPIPYGLQFNRFPTFLHSEPWTAVCGIDIVARSDSFCFRSVALVHDKKF